ncbi:uncharacterized protein LOC142595112 [Pelecanus crispus]|uniref:uncharacterized protein LOC142595112 n=1 Tax=Pelecanus crispus TaxID=36300 RepID=UPI003F5D0E4F
MWLRRRPNARGSADPGALQLGADLPGAFSSLGPGPGRAFGKMFSPLGCRRGFPREPSPWDPRPFHDPADFHGNEEDRRWAPHDCPPLPPWDNGEERQGPEHCFRENWHPPIPGDPRPFHDPADFHGNEEDRRWAPHDCPPPPPWDNEEERQGPEHCFRENWHPPVPGDPRPFHDPADFHGNEEDRRWAPHDCPPPPPWDDREDNPGPEHCFREGWHPEPPLSGPGCSAWPIFPDEEQHPPSLRASWPGKQDGFQGSCLTWGYRGQGGKRCRRLRRGHRELTLVQRLPCPRPSRAPSSDMSSHGLSPMRCHRAPYHGVPQGPPAVSGEVQKPPGPAGTPQKSPATDPRAARDAAEPEQAAGATPVEPGARHKPVGSHGQGPSVLETEPALPEESSAGTGERLEVEPHSQSIPKADADDGLHPHGPTAPPAPAERVCAAASSAGEVGAELCPPSQGRQPLLSGAGEAKTEAARDGLLGGLQPSENSQVPSGATVEPDTQPSQACSRICAVPETSPGTQHPPGSGETEPVRGQGASAPPQAAGGQRRLCSALPTSSPAGTDLRSAAVLARKEEIELSYQQFSLTIAVVATMLLQKEPSMEAALGPALRANLRQGRIHHLQELEDFINSYDSATLSR